MSSRIARHLAIAALLLAPPPVSADDCGALYFDEGLDGTVDFVFLGVKGPLQLRGDLTLEMWVRLASEGSASFLVNGRIGSDLASKNALYQLGVTDEGRLQLFWESGPGIDVAVDSTESVVLDVGQWHHVAAVRDAAARSVMFYADGQPLGVPVEFSLDPSDGEDASLTFGASHRATGDFRSTFEGDLDDVRIWETVRSAEEIRAHYDTELSGDETGLAGYWNFNGEGQLVIDVGPDGLDGTLGRDTEEAADDPLRIDSEVPPTGDCSTPLQAIRAMVRGFAPTRVACRNLTTGQELSVEPPRDITAWNCEAAGLLFAPGDVVAVEAEGMVPE